MIAQEYSDMIGAIELHHNSLRLAHLTGKAKDLVWVIIEWLWRFAF